MDLWIRLFGVFGMGTAMDSTTLQELIAEIRETTTSLAGAERKVAAFTAELAEQDHGAQLAITSDRLGAIPAPKPKPVNAGWVPAIAKTNQ
jgi:hypothetical protein